MSDNEDNIFDDDISIDSNDGEDTEINIKTNKNTISLEDDNDSDYEEDKDTENIVLDNDENEESDIDDKEEESDNENDIDYDDYENEDDKKESNRQSTKNVPVSKSLPEHMTVYDNTSMITNNIIEDNDDDEEPDENYLQKFETNIKENFVSEFHPETHVQNYEEIVALSKVIRDKNNIIVDPLHKTIPVLTKYERTRVLGQRTKQLENGAKPYISVPDNIIDSHLIAELELDQKRVPFIIRRPLPGGAGSEYWSLKDLEVITM